MNAHDFSEALCVSTKPLAPQEGTNELRGFTRFDVEINQTIVAMSKAGIIKVSVPCEERRAVQAVQQGNDLVKILHSEPANFNPNLPHANPPHFEPPSLRFVDVFIENDHAARLRLSILVVSASLARLMASPMASRLMLFR